MLSQVCGFLPLHWRAPGWQLPPHTPAPVQASGQTVPVCHLPVASQVCGVTSSRQRALVGLHSPLHTPAPLQTYGQSLPLTQLPLDEQLCGVTALPHCDVPGTH